MPLAPRLPDRLRLATPPIARIVPDDVFDAYGWCASDTLEWRRPAEGRYAWDASASIAATNPARMVFVMHASCTFLPQESAALHAFGLGLEDERCLAPYAIDDATDELYARRARPRELFWLAADNLNALFWGLHDWAHFHNHGDFEPSQRAWTEVQCDASALAWMWRNRATLELSSDVWERARSQAFAACARRFEVDNLAVSATDLGVLSAESLKKLAAVERVS